MSFVRIIGLRRKECCYVGDTTLSVRLQSDVVYVTGTVNDVPTTWTQQENGTWMTTADRAADDVYRVELELINSAGRTYTASFTLYYGLLNLITDRTQADVDCVRQLAAKGWAAMTRGRARGVERRAEGRVQRL